MEPTEASPAFMKDGVALFNAGKYWESHEALEQVWRAAPEADRDLWKGLIQAAAAMLHRTRGNQHGMEVVGASAVGKLAAPAPADFPIETSTFGTELARCLEGAGPVPVMKEKR